VRTKFDIYVFNYNMYSIKKFKNRLHSEEYNIFVIIFYYKMNLTEKDNTLIGTEIEHRHDWQ
jgi:hypothetical protein